MRSLFMCAWGEFWTAQNQKAAFQSCCAAVLGCITISFLEGSQALPLSASEDRQNGKLVSAGIAITRVEITCLHLCLGEFAGSCVGLFM